MTDILPVPNQLGREHLLDTIQCTKRFRLVIWNLPTHEGIATQPLAERFCLVAEVFISFARSEMQLDPLADRKLGAVFGQFFQCCQMRVAGVKMRDVAEIASV